MTILPHLFVGRANVSLAASSSSSDHSVSFLLYVSNLFEAVFPALPRVGAYWFISARFSA
jgi:hypothetical protein